MYSSVTKNILDHKIQFHYVFTTFKYYRVVSRNTKAWSNTPRKISGGSRNLWWVRGYKPSRGLGDAGSPLGTKLNVTSRLMYSIIHRRRNGGGQGGFHPPGICQVGFFPPWSRTFYQEGIPSLTRETPG